jgi:hypothetical protein
VADKLYRISFHAKPITVHAPNEKRAIDVALEYLRQPETQRIVVEPADKDSNGVDI